LKQTKIVFLTSVHRPFDPRIFYKECRTLAREGFEVVLIAPHERAEIVDGVRIRPILKSQNRFKRMVITVFRVLKAAVDEGGSIYHFHDPELIIVGLLLKLKGKRVIYDVHEDVPKDILTKPYISPLVRRWLALLTELIEHFASSFFDGIVAATPSIGKRFPSKKTVIVQNFPYLQSGFVESLPYAKRPFQAAYSGNITVIRGAIEMVKAIAKLPGNLGAKLALAGDFSPLELETEVRNLSGWERVDFIGWRSPEEVASLLGHSRMGLVIFHPVPNHLEAQPQKLFEYMLAGLPIIASDFPLWRQIIVGTGCGILVNPLDPQAIAKAIQWVLEHPIEAEEMGLRGREVVYSQFNWANEGEKLLDLYRRLTAPSGTEAL
jgi:glycosyltransferase involved in cell wall biosynthesis